MGSDVISLIYHFVNKTQKIFFQSFIFSKYGIPVSRERFSIICTQSNPECKIAVCFNTMLTKPLNDFSVKSNSRAKSRASPCLYSTGPTQAMSFSFDTPQHIFPASINAMPPNVPRFSDRPIRYNRLLNARSNCRHWANALNNH